MYYSQIYNYDTENSVNGFSVSIFFSYCKLHCPFCFNPDTWCKTYGQEFTKETIEYILKCLESEHINQLNLLGGNPLDSADDPILRQLIISVREKFQNSIDIYLWSGYYWDEIIEDRSMKNIMSYCDVLIDGRFEYKQRNLNLKLRGSNNQRIIDIKQSLLQNKTILHPLND